MLKKSHSINPINSNVTAIKLFININCICYHHHHIIAMSKRLSHFTSTRKITLIQLLKAFGIRRKKNFFLTTSTQNRMFRILYLIKISTIRVPSWSINDILHKELTSVFKTPLRGHWLKFLSDTFFFKPMSSFAIKLI